MYVVTEKNVTLLSQTTTHVRSHGENGMLFYNQLKPIVLIRQALSFINYHLFTTDTSPFRLETLKLSAALETLQQHYLTTTLSLENGNKAGI